MQFTSHSTLASEKPLLSWLREVLVSLHARTRVWHETNFTSHSELASEKFPALIHSVEEGGPHSSFIQLKRMSSILFSRLQKKKAANRSQWDYRVFYLYRVRFSVRFKVSDEGLYWNVLESIVLTVNLLESLMLTHSPLLRRISWVRLDTFALPSA